MDFLTQDHGSIVILVALSDDAQQWVAEHLPEDRLTWGTKGAVVEPRYAQPILEGIVADGLEVA